MPPKKQRMKRAKKGARKYPISKGYAGVPDQASLSEVFSNRTGTGPRYASNVSYRLYNLSLATFPRASTVAQGYQEFRIRRIMLTFKTTQDTFTGGANTAPNLYYMIDRKGVIPINFTIDTLQQMGAKPRRLDDKNLTVKYAPAVLQASLTDPAALTTGVAAAQISPWLPTNNSPNAPLWTPSDVDHFGLSWQSFIPDAAGQVNYDIDIQVEFEFRKPRFNSPLPSSPVALSWDFGIEKGVTGGASPP